MDHSDWGGSEREKLFWISSPNGRPVKALEKSFLPSDGIHILDPCPTVDGSLQLLVKEEGRLEEINEKDYLRGSAGNAAFVPLERPSSTPSHSTGFFPKSIQHAFDSFLSGTDIWMEVSRILDEEDGENEVLEEPLVVGKHQNRRGLDLPEIGKDGADAESQSVLATDEHEGKGSMEAKKTSTEVIKSDGINTTDGLRDDSTDIDELIFGVEERVKESMTAQSQFEHVPEDRILRDDTLFATWKDGYIDPMVDEILDTDDLSYVYNPAKKIAAEVEVEDEWAIQDGGVVDYHTSVPHPALEFPFDLDEFQARAIIRLEQGQCVFVAAHTSAGKTVVAEYAIAMSLMHRTRAIYTSPIKTLSNQKYREFKKKFDDVGIMTGDVQINPSASCLIMTTEILRSMLYRGSDVVRDVEWVIFDEVHYVNDYERGVVWEEVIIMLPPHVNMIFLSATVPNALEFASWIGMTKKRKVYVVSTLKRPVALEHYLYFSNEFFKIVDKNKVFLQEGYRAATAEARLKAQKHEGTKKKIPFGHQKPKKRVDGWPSFVKLLQERDKLPAVTFMFSKNRCENIADSLSRVDLVTGAEKGKIRVFLDKCLSRLKPEDQQLPQLQRLRDLLSHGIGVHHAGLLPFAKEVVEILFSRGLCKFLVATETFAMGVNMPARTVVFGQLTKNDGTQFRSINPGEYTQMSGRAGRRGLDAVGEVVIYCENEIEPEHSLYAMTTGQPTKLESKFKLGYRMILSLLRVEHFRVESVMKRSFAEFSSQKHVPRQQRLLEETRRVLTQLPEYISDPHSAEWIQEYATLAFEFDQIRSKFVEKLMEENRSAFQTRGRFLIVDTKRGILPAVILGQGSSTSVQCVCPSAHGIRAPECLSLKWVPSFDSSILDSTFTVEQIPLGSIRVIYDHSFENIEKDDLVDVQDAMKDILQPSKKLQLRAIEYERVSKSLDAFEMLSAMDSVGRSAREIFIPDVPRFEQEFVLCSKRQFLRSKVERLEHLMSDKSLYHMTDLEARLRVLERLGYISPDHIVLLKGRVACEISTCDELIVTELIFDNFLNELSPQQVICVLSALICQEKNVRTPDLTEFMIEAKVRLEAITNKLYDLQVEEGVTMEDDSLARVNVGLMVVAMEWANGKPFVEICELTEILEGSIVRNIVQLEQACREVKNAARCIGDSILFKKMETAERIIKRDIVFSASLYVS